MGTRGVLGLAGLAAVVAVLLVWFAAMRAPAAVREAPPSPGREAPATPPAPDAAWVVVDARGVGVSGVFVRGTVGEAFTDAAGRFQPPAGDGLLRFRRSGFARRVGRVDEREFPLARELVIRGRVVDAGGEGLPDCRIRVRLAAPLAEDSVRSGEAGAFEVRELPAGPVELRVIEGGWQADAITTAAGREGVSLVVVRTATVRGRVVDDRGAPVSAAAIHDEERAWADGRRLEGAVATANADGEFEFEATVGAARAYFAVGGGVRSETRRVPLDRPIGVLEEPFVVEPGRPAVSYVSVRAIGPDGKAVAGEVRWSERAWLPSGVRRNAWGSAALPPMKEPLGTVVPGSFYAHRHPAETDGSYSLELWVPPRTPVELFFEPERKSGLLPARLVTETRASRPDAPLELACGRGVRRRIGLVDADGSSCGFSLELAGPFVDAGSAGEMELYVLDPKATYRVVAHGFHVEELDAHWSPPAEDRPIVFRTERAWLLPNESAPLAVRLLHPDGEPLARVKFGFVAAFDPVPDAFPFHGPIDGEFERVPPSLLIARYAGLGTRVLDRIGETLRFDHAAALRVRVKPPGRWRLADWRIDVRASGWATALPYRLRKETTREFRIEPAQSSSSHERDYHWWASETLPPGASGRLRDLPPGPCEVRLWTDGWSMARTVVLVSGMERSVAFEAR